MEMSGRGTCAACEWDLQHCINEFSWNFPAKFNPCRSAFNRCTNAKEMKMRRSVWIKLKNVTTSIWFGKLDGRVCLKLLATYTVSAILSPLRIASLPLNSVQQVNLSDNYICRLAVLGDHLSLYASILMYLRSQHPHGVVDYSLVWSDDGGIYSAEKIITVGDTFNWISTMYKYLELSTRGRAGNNRSACWISVQPLQQNIQIVSTN